MSEGSQPGAPSPWDPPSGAPGYGPGPQPPPPPPGWHPGPVPPAYGQPYPPAGYYPPQAAYGGAGQGTNGMAIASMVLGILWLYWVGSVLALVFGYVAKKQIAERYQGGGGMATAGIVLGWVGVGTLLLFLVIGGLAAVSFS